MANESLSGGLVSFVLPAYNEGAFIRDTLERLDSRFWGNGFPYEIVVVDDGSVDDTRVRALSYGIGKEYVRVIGYTKNVGKGFAIKKGFREAKGEAVVFFDSDSDIDVGQIQICLDSLKNGDIAIGSKWLRNSVVEMPLIRRFLSRGFNVLARLLTGVDVSDTQTGIKAVRRDVFSDAFRRMCVKRYAFDVELLVLAKLNGFRVTEIPVKLKLNGLFSLREVWRMFMDLLGIFYRLRVRKWYTRGISKHSHL
jgi:glycosyltransferase involved in cell wall biosynthesis